MHTRRLKSARARPPAKLRRKIEHQTDDITQFEEDREVEIGGGEDKAEGK